MYKDYPYIFFSLGVLPLLFPPINFKFFNSKLIKGGLLHLYNLVLFTQQKKPNVSLTNKGLHPALIL